MLGRGNLVGTGMMPPRLSGWHLRALVLSITIGMSSYLAFSIWGGWEQVMDAFSRIGLAGIAIALSLSLLNYGLRFVRWQAYLYKLEHPIPWLPSLKIYLSGYALTTTPGKAGEAFRGVFLKQYKVPFPTTFAAFISERLSDLVAVVLLTLLGLAQYPAAQGIVLAGTGAILAVLICLSSQRLLCRINHWSKAKRHKICKLITHMTQILQTARRCHQPKLLLLATTLSLIAWGAEAFAFYCVLKWLGADLSLAFAIFVYALSMLAGALSFLPGGLGGAEAIMISLLIYKGMPMPEAIAATVFIRLATLWFAVVIGLLALYRCQHAKVIDS